MASTSPEIRLIEGVGQSPILRVTVAPSLTGDKGRPAGYHGAMSAQPDAYTEALDRALLHTHAWLASLPSRPIGPRVDADTLAALSAGPLPPSPCAHTPTP